MDSKTKKIIVCGIPLFCIGVNNWALTKDQALMALDIFKEQGVAIIGGDIFTICNGQPKHTYDSWFCEEKKDEETNSEFISRCFTYTRNYIMNYENNDIVEPFFTFVNGC